MRWFLRISALLLVLLAAYAVWPIYGLYRIVATVEARNAAALSDVVDFVSVRRSLSRQIVLAYLNLTGQDTGLGKLGTQVAVGVGASIADPIVAKLVNPEALLELLSRGNAGGVAGVPSLPAPISSESVSSFWRVWRDSEYSGRSYYVWLPPDRPAAERFRLELRVIRWRWQLVSIDLPEDLRVRLAQEVAKATAR